MSHIRDLLVNRITETLTAAMITDIPRGTPTRANEVKAYRFQADPTKTPIYMFVTPGDIGDIKFIDGRVSVEEMEDLGMHLPAGEVGGGHLWWRRGKVELGCYFVVNKYTQLISAAHAHEVLGRVTNTVESTYVSDLLDSFGEQGLDIMVYANTFFESGGPPDQYIWRGSIFWQALTERAR